jgi:hypothetical protein
VAVTSAAALATYRFPLHLGVLVAIAAGVGAALLTDWVYGRGRRWSAT